MRRKQRMQNPTLLTLSLVIIFYLLFNPSSAPASDSKVFTFGVVPQQSAMVLAKRWMPIFKELEKETGYKFVFKTDKTIPEFEKKLSEKKYDIAYMNPYHYTVFHKITGYKAIAKQGNKQIKGILVAHNDSNITSLSDLNQKTLAFPAPAAFAATVIPQSVFKNQGLFITSKYVSSHESVYKNVAYKNFIAGGGIERTFNNLPEEIKSQLKVIWKSKGYTPHAFALSSTINDEDSAKIQNALIGLSSTDKGKELLKAINFKSIVAASNSDWDDVRELDIDLLESLSHVTTSLNKQ